MDIRTAPVEDIYHDMLGQWHILSELFSKSKERGPPLLAVFDIERWLGFFGDVSSFHGVEFYPGGSDAELVAEITGRITERPHPGAYWSDLHTISLDRRNLGELFRFVLAEEVMHSVVDVPKARMDIPANAFREFNGPYKGFGNSLFGILEPLNRSAYEISLNEFFPPLAQLHLFGTTGAIEDNDWLWQLRSIMFFQPEKTLEKRAEEAENVILHLPRAAGYLLAQHYEGDIKALLREHPSLPHLSGSELWENYCGPILVNGKL